MAEHKDEKKAGREYTVDEILAEYGSARVVEFPEGEKKPPAEDSPLRALPNVILTPHLAGLSNNGQRRIGMHAADEIGRFLAGRPMECEVTREMLARMA